MKIKKDGVEYEVVFKLPDDAPKTASNMLNEWANLVKKEELKKKRMLRLKKLKKINKKG